jgi:hypothetical protein
MTRRHFWLGVFVVVAVLGIAYTVYWYCDMGHAPVEKMPWLHGKTVEEVESILGSPSEEYSISLDQARDEFRCELLNYYPLDNPENAKVEFKELWWKRSRHTITVWFHRIGGQWLVLETCRWQKGITF